MDLEPKSKMTRFGAALLSALWISSPALASASVYGSAPATPVYSNLKLLNGSTATVYANGLAKVVSGSKGSSKIEYETIQPGVHFDGGPNTAQTQLPDEGHILAQLNKGPQQPFVPSRVIVVYRDSVSTMQDVVTVNATTLKTMRAATAKKALSMVGLPAYTTDVAVNLALGNLGADSHERLFRQFSKSTLSMLRSTSSTSGVAALNFANAYRVHITNGSVRQAVQTLAKLPEVAYVSPDWSVSPMHSQGIPLQSSAVTASRQQAEQMAFRPRTMSSSSSSLSSTLPTNYAITASEQSMLNEPGVDAVAAYDEVETKFGQLPGTGEIITNVSLGDLDDASEAGNYTDPCGGYVQAYGPTTEVVGGQRYLNLPSMPLIPTYVSDASSDLSGSEAICGIDPFLDEVGMDFSVMSPLPHDQQRAGEVGSGVTDLLGIAPGASYRLIVPSGEATSDMDAAFLAAAQQVPRPNVITASLGFGYDQYGFSGRYEEEDPLTEALIQSIVQNYNIVVCISAGDGTRTYTNVAIGPSGGSVPTNVVPTGGTPTSLTDVALSTAPSAVFDSGSIDVGATTLNDIFSDEPQYQTPALAARQAYTETRWNGLMAFSSGFGSRVDVSAPGDNIVTMEHAQGGADDGVDVILNGGTSASAPETAAAAAVVLQVARLSNHPLTAVGVRQVLEQTGTTEPNVDQADVNLAVGPQVDLRAAVESLLGSSSTSKPGVPRVAVAQRIDYANYDSAFFGPTDPTNINLSGGPRPGANWLAWITIAPDWEFIPKNARYSLFVKTSPASVLATTPSARLLPATIFSAAKLNVHTTTSKSVTLVYEALQGSKVLASVDVPLTFGAPPTTEDAMLAPKVPAVVTGSTIPVQYDMTSVGDLNNPQLVVSAPGRFLPIAGPEGALQHTLYTAPLSETKGTIDVPVSQLQGGGVYSIAIVNHSAVNGTYYSDFAFTRVAVPEGASRPAAPLLSVSGSTSGAAPGHFLEIPYGSTFQVQYDVSNVPHATGAELEISAPGPGIYGLYNPFNNPNGSIEDKNGIDTGSVYYAPVSGASGTVTLNSATIGLDPALDHLVRVIPTNGTTVVGEGSDVSSVEMDGVIAGDGGVAFEGFGINQNGTDGVLTSYQPLTGDIPYGSFDIFNQTTNQISDYVQSGSNNAFSTTGWAIWANDIGLVCDLNNIEYCLTYGPTATGAIKAYWTGQNGGTNFVDTAPNSATDVGAFLTLGAAGWQIMLADLNANTTTATYSLNTVTGVGAPQYNGIAENTTTNTAVLPMYDITKPPAPMVGLVNLANGTITSFNGVGTGTPQGIAVDSTSNIAAMPTSDGGLGIYNLATQTGNEVSLPNCTGCGDSGVWAAVDPTNSLFLVAEPTGSDYLTNNNAMSWVDEYNESGTLVKSLETFSLINMQLEIQTNWLQVNPTTRKGYIMGPGGAELQPFSY